MMFGTVSVQEGAAPRSTIFGIPRRDNSASVLSSACQLYSVQYQAACRTSTSGRFARIVSRIFSVIRLHSGLIWPLQPSSGAQALAVYCAMPKPSVPASVRRPGASADAWESPQRNRSRPSSTRSRHASEKSSAPVAELCFIPIYINLEENQQRYTPVSSRIAHLVVIDVMAIGVAMLRGDALQEHLKLLNKTLNH